MNDVSDFVNFCVESYSAEKNLTENEVVLLFKEYGVFDYLNTCYDVLHTTGRAYLMEDIDIFIKVRKKN